MTLTTILSVVGLAAALAGLVATILTAPETGRRASPRALVTRRFGS